MISSSIDARHHWLEIKLGKEPHKFHLDNEWVTLALTASMKLSLSQQHQSLSETNFIFIQF